MGKIADFFFGERDDTSPLETREPEPQHDPTAVHSVPSRANTPVTLSPTDALGLSSVYRAVGVRVTAIKQLSIDVERAGEVIASPLFIRRPDIDTSWRVFAERTVVSLNLAGNAYWRIRRDTAGAVQSLEVLNPHDVTIRTSETGRIVGFSHQGYELKLPDIQHLSRIRVPGTPYGLGPIQAAALELRGALDLRDYSANWFRESGTPSGVLKSDAPLTAEAAKAAKTAWTESHGGKRGVAVLGSGLNYSAVTLTPADAQFLESRQFTITEIARLFGVPASLMLAAVEGNSMTYSNVEQDWLAFVRFGLTDDLLEIEDALSELLPRGQRARFNIEALLRTDTTSRYAAHAAGISAGWLLPSEVRVIENLPAIEGIDTRPRPKEDR